MRKTIHSLLFVFCLGVSLFLSRSLWVKPVITASFDVVNEKPYQIQIFYTQKDGEIFNQTQSVKKKVGSGQQHVEINLPISHLKKFRIDFGDEPGKIEISNLNLNGKETKSLSFSNFNPNAPILTYIPNENTTIIVSNAKDPFIVLKKTVNLDGRYTIDYCILTILICFFGFIFSKSIGYLSNFKELEQHSVADIILLSIFFILLFIPMTDISDAQKSEKENRMLASKASLFQKDGRIDNNFGKKFDAWFSDHFYGRDFLSDLHQAIEYKIAKSAGNKNVLVGKDGWLFYRGNNSVQNYANSPQLTENHLKKTLNYLTDIHNWTKKEGKDFYFFVAPDKNRIYGEHYPSYVNKIRSDEHSIGHQLVKYISENSNINVVYPHKDLIENKDKGFLYYKQDTHWTPLGAYIGYQKLMEKMQLKANSFDFSENTYDGDLWKMFTSEVKDETKYPLPKNLISNCVEKANDFIYCKNPLGNKKAFILGDSFTQNLQPFLNSNFEEIYLYSRRKITKEDLDLIRQKNIDFIILEVVERFSIQLDLTFPKE